MKRVLCVIGLLLLVIGCNAQQTGDGESKAPEATQAAGQGKNPFGKTELHKAVTSGDAEQVKSLLAKNDDALLLAKDKFGDTALHIAVARGNVEVAKMLLDRGANPFARDARGETPLHDAVSDGNTEMVKLLLENGADAGMKDDDGETPRDRAKSEEMKKLLGE